MRPVPRVTIDFGNDRVVRRTIQGNIATWICSSDVTAIDVLPGIYKANAYKNALEKIVAVHREYRSHGKSSPAEFLAVYHESEIKSRQNRNIKDAPKGSRPTIPGLHQDTYFNNLVRRLMTHKKLRDSGMVTPDDLTPWLYRKVLKTDLDDPYLGLKPALFDNYPFTAAELTKFSR